MPEHRLPAKLARPRLYDAVERERLFALLDGERERPLIWVAGPPGSGKTTLVTSYLASRRAATLWYRVDEGDADAATFFSYLAQGARAVTRKRKLVLPALTPEYLLDLPGFTRRYFRTLFGALPAGGVLVLDSYENAAGGALDALLAIAVDEVPPRTRILVTSREAPGTALAHLQAKGSLSLVPWEELRLTESEAKTIAGGASVPAASIDTLHTLSDGWAAGFVVLLEHVRRSKAPDPHASGALRESLFAYFVNEMFARAEESVRIVLIRTALVPGFTGAHARALCPDAEAEEILQRLYRRHYFIDRSAGPEPVYRYHALFRDFLLEQGRTLLGAGERARLLIEAGELLESGGRGEEAVGLYIEAQAWPRAAKLICELAPGFLGGGRNAGLGNVISVIPQAIIDEVPWLSYWLGMARLPFNPPAGRILLEAAHARFEANSDGVGSLMSCAGVLDSYMMEWHDVRAIDRWGDVFNSLVQSVFPVLEAEIRGIASLVVLNFRGDVHRPLLERVYVRACELIPMAADAVQRIALANFCGLHCVASGKWKDLRQLLAGIEPTIQTVDIPPIYQLMWFMLKLWDTHQHGEFAEALQVVTRAEALAESTGVHVLDMFIASHGVHAAINAGDLTRVEAYVDRMRAILHPARVLDAANYDYTASELALARGDPAVAIERARVSLEKIAACGANLARAQVQIALAHALLDSGAHGPALLEIERILEYAAAARHHALGHAGLMLKAEAFRLAGRLPASVLVLRQGLALGRELGVVVIFPWAPVPFMQRIFGLALAEGIETAYVRDLIRKLNVPAPVTAGDSWPWPVRIYTLGRFEIVIGETKVEYRRKLPKRPLAVLKFLLARRGQARVEQAIDALWAQEEADAAANALDAALHRLRRLLGGPGTVESHDGQLTLDRKAVWVDAFAFEWTLDSVEGGSRDLYRQALESYRGHFLAADQAEPWSISTRERLRSRFIRAVAAHGQALQSARDFESAAAHYARAIDIDDLIEAFYQGLMQCQLALKQRSEGLATYQRLKRTLAAGLNLQPAAASEQLHQGLRGI